MGYKNPLLSHRRSLWILCLLGFTMSCGLYAITDFYEKKFIYESVQEVKSALANQIKDRLESVIFPLTHMGKRWEFEEGVAKRDWTHEATNFIEQMHGYQAIEWINSKYIVTWITPFKNNESVLGFNITQEHHHLRGKVAEATRTVQITEVIDLLQGGKGILVYVPLYPKNKFDGFIVGAFRLSDLLGDIINKFGTNYSIAVSDTHQNFMVFDNGHKITRLFPKAQAPISIKMYGQTWLLSMWPGDRFYAEKRTWIPFSAFGMGLFATLVAFMLLNLARSSNMAKETAEIADRAKSFFLSNMSHEIRTPLTAMLGFSEALFNDNIPEGEKKFYIERIYRNGSHLAELINDILDFAKIEANKINLEKVDFSLPNLLEDVMHIIKMQANSKNINLYINHIYPLPLRVRSDPTRIKQILINLCGNAVKFTKSGYVQLLVSYNQSKDLLEFCVTDTGIGIPPNKLKQIFDPFSQADSSTTRTYGGTGLGLCISDQLAQAMGGEIALTSEVNVGSRFKASLHVDLPAPRQFAYNASDLIAEQKSSLVYKPPPQLQGHVLVAEDWPDNQQLIELYLKQMGLEHTIVGNGQLAVEHALQQDPNLILMDIQMPIMDGLRATELLRATGFTTPIIALTANVMKGEIREYIEKGFSQCLGKPIDRQRFNDLLATYLPLKTEAPPDRSREQLNENYQALIQQFKDNLPKRIEAIEKAVKVKNWKELKSLIHVLKGMGGSFGYPEITEISTVIDKKLAKDQIHEALKHLPKLYSLSQKIASE